MFPGAQVVPVLRQRVPGLRVGRPGPRRVGSALLRQARLRAHLRAVLRQELRLVQ